MCILCKRHYHFREAADLIGLSLSLPTEIIVLMWRMFGEYAKVLEKARKIQNNNSIYKIFKRRILQNKLKIH